MNHRVRLGLLSDTHLYAPAFRDWEGVLRGLRGVDLILHAGDIQAGGVLDSLESVAPVVAALGNNDYGYLERDPRVSPVQVLELAGWRVGLVHDIEPEERPLPVMVAGVFPGPVDLVVSGHTHFERISLEAGMVHVNPGSPNLPHNYSHRLGAVGIVELEPGAIRVEIVRLGESDGLRNPSSALLMEARRGPRGITVNGRDTFLAAPDRTGGRP